MFSRELTSRHSFLLGAIFLFQLVTGKSVSTESPVEDERKTFLSRGIVILADEIGLLRNTIIKEKGYKGPQIQTVLYEEGSNISKKNRRPSFIEEDQYYKKLMAQDPEDETPDYIKKILKKEEKELEPVPDYILKQNEEKNDGTTLAKYDILSRRSSPSIVDRNDINGNLKLTRIQKKNQEEIQSNEIQKMKLNDTESSSSHIKSNVLVRRRRTIVPQKHTCAPLDDEAKKLVLTFSTMFQLNKDVLEPLWAIVRYLQQATNVEYLKLNDDPTLSDMYNPSLVVLTQEFAKQQKWPELAYAESVGDDELCASLYLMKRNMVVQKIINEKFVDMTIS